MEIKTFGPSIRDAYNGSFYTIAVREGDSVEDTVNDYIERLTAEGFPIPSLWITTTSAEINEFANTFGEVVDPLPDWETFVLFPLDGMDSRLAYFKIANGNRWFDDIIDNLADNIN